jgi:hypothetical protein
MERAGVHGASGHDRRMLPVRMSRQVSSLSVVAAACLLATAGESAPAAAQRAAAVRICAPAEKARPLPALQEASGAALSRRTAGVLWSINDSGQPIVYAIDTATGAERGRVRISNATVVDWEDVSIGACPGGSCLYVADIGDNNRARPSITVYRVLEPQPQDAQSAAADVFTAVYPDGAHDAEALFLSGDDLFVVTKDATTALYRFPKSPKPGAKLTLERVGALPLRRVTDAETSVDGAWVAVRTNVDVAFYRTADLARGKNEGVTMPLRALKEAQGEGVAMDAAGMVYLTGEGQRAGSLNTLRCTLPK